MSGNSVQLEPVLGLGDEWPETLYIVCDMDSDRCGCYCFNGIHGLAVFSDSNRADDFISLSGMKAVCIRRVSFDHARDVAKKRPLPVVAMMLCDDLENPIVHYVR